MAFHPASGDSSTTISPWEDSQGSLPPEIDIEGNVEYKLKLIATAPDRFDHLVTQLKWRLSEGHGSAIYEIGVADDGSFVGLSPEDMEVSLQTLFRMADALSADVTILRRVSVETAQRQHLDLPNQDQEEMDSPNASSSAATATTTTTTRTTATTFSSTPIKSASSPRTDPEFLVVEARVTSRLSRKHHFVEIRVALVGGPDAGKSTLLGRLAHGIADNGRGKARLNMLRHRHEISSGRTSSISHEIIGFDDEGATVNYNTTHISTWQEICESSKKVVTLLDTCGHPRFLKTTIAGLTGHAPDYACLVVDSRVGGVNEMTKEHLALATLLGLPTFVVVTKMDVATHEQLRATVTALMLLIKRVGASYVDLASLETMIPRRQGSSNGGDGGGSGNNSGSHHSSGRGGATAAATDPRQQPQQGGRRFIPVIVQHTKDLEAVVEKFANQDRIETTNTVVIPILLLSSVTGENVHLLERLLYLLPKTTSSGNQQDSQLLADPACFQIEEIYNIPDIGTVVGGFLHSGRIEVQDMAPDMETSLSFSPSSTPRAAEQIRGRRRPRLYLGPVDNDGSFIPIHVKSIHRQRMSMRSADSGQMATIALESPTITQSAQLSSGSGSTTTTTTTTTTMLDTVKVRRGMVILESDTDPRGTCCQQFEAVIQVLAHEGAFGLGFQGMIHCGSVHRNAKIVKIRLLSDDSSDGHSDSGGDAEGHRGVGNEAATNGSTIEMALPPPRSAAVPAPLVAAGTRTVGVENEPMAAMGPVDEDVDEPQSEGSITPVSESGSWSGSASSSVPGSGNGSIYQGKDRHNSLLQQRLGGSGGGSKSGQAAAGRIPIATMRQLHRLSLQSRPDGAVPQQPGQKQHRSNIHSAGLEEASTRPEDERTAYASRDSKEEEDEEDEDQTVQLSVGSRARVVFEFCHEVVFMREGTTVLFRQGRSKCVGKVVRMLS
ncbi:GTP binding protein [Actinomortierella ambigua]|uniref:GTP binding protein n=1 Tax=Actinomortierella ambigua TaxID=1343610 RepID=A0A9P6QHE1_9FUNG|nr:GTP binding protein [Actinomortierella ambigua]